MPKIYQVGLCLILVLLSPVSWGQTIELGAANASGEWTDAHYIRISDRVGKWGIGMAHVGEQGFSSCPEWGPKECYVYAYRQLFVDVTRYFRWGWFEFGVGPSLAQHQTRITPAHLNFHLQLSAYYKRLSLSIHHYSNAGTSPTGYNMGQDALALGYTF